MTAMSSSAFAQSISATGSTLASAEAKIAAQAQKAGAAYKITSAQMNNQVYMTAELTAK
ncbi:YdgH/BhsA/McbA-like domain containing protein [Chania multitudinisentens]